MSPAEPSKVMLDECFLAEDDRFLDELAKFNGYEFLKHFATRWANDSREWSRSQVVAYLNRDLNYPGHEVVYKRLFKHFEGAEDHEMMTHFMVSTDRLVRRSRTRSQRYNWRTRETTVTERLYACPNKTVIPEAPGQRTAVSPYNNREYTYYFWGVRNSDENRLFTQRTRSYLRRRVWRYFRRLSYQQPEQYRTAMIAAFRQYTDADLATGENIIDNWSLMHACYFHHDTLTFTANHTNLASGASLSRLAAAPYQPTVWQQSEAFAPVLELVEFSQSTLIRTWGLEMLQQLHADRLREIDVETLLRLLGHIDPRVQEFAANLFHDHPQLPALELSTWLRLVRQSHVSVLPIVCDAMKTHVQLERLSNDDIVQLSCAKPTPVAQMGFGFLKQRHSDQPIGNEELLPLSEPECIQLAGDIAQWAIEAIGSDGRYQSQHIIEFVDSPMEDVRERAMDWVVDPESLGYSDPALWAFLIETPYDDVRLRLVESLEKRVKRHDANATKLSSVWASVILNVHRGNRTKMKAIRQVTRAIQEDHSQFDRLMPVVVVAIRSIRGPERRNALAAVVTMARESSELRQRVSESLPELEWVEGATV